MILVDCEWSQMLSIIISFFSLVISGYVLWSSRLAPFKLRVMPSRRIDLIQTPPPASLVKIVIPLLFVNEGAQRGYVTNVGASIGDDNGACHSFVALFDDVSEVNFAVENMESVKWGAFSTFCINPGETILKRLVFVPNDEDSFNFHYRVGTFSLTLYTIMDGWPDWNRQFSTTFELTDETVATLVRPRLALESGTVPSSLCSVLLGHEIVILANFPRNHC